MFEALEWAKRPPLDPATTALVVVDMINHQLQPGPTCLGDLTARGIDTRYYAERVESQLIPNHQKLIAACRGSGASVVFLRIGSYRHDFGDAVPALRERLKRWGAVDGSWACEVDPRLDSQSGDISLIKTGSGGFLTSGLDSHLRNAGIRNVLYTGVVTNGCVLLTATSGFDLGYEGYLVGDATATFSPQLQQATEDIISGVYAPVVTTEDTVRMLIG